MGLVCEVPSNLSGLDLLLPSLPFQEKTNRARPTVTGHVIEKTINGCECACHDDGSLDWAQRFEAFRYHIEGQAELPADRSQEGGLPIIGLDKGDAEVRAHDGHDDAWEAGTGPHIDGFDILQFDMVRDPYAFGYVPVPERTSRLVRANKIYPG